MKKTFSLTHLLTVTCFGIAAAVSITVMIFQSFLAGQEKNESEEYLSKIQEIEELVNEYYTGEIDSELILDGISAGYIYGLNDRYSNYVSADDAEANMNTLYGLNTGMGIQVTQHPNTKNLYVLEVHNGSPAMTAGILPGDEIVKLDDNTVAEYGYSETLIYVKSQPLGTTLHAIINRGGETVETDIVLTQYNSQSVFYKMLDNDKGYIQITEFNELSIEQFKDAVDTLVKDGAAALVFDLRGNGGGTLRSVYQILDYLIPEGLVVRVEYKNENHNEVYMSDASEIDLPMVVLTDGNTASASELFSQTLKDYSKAITVGRTTFGKGVMQRTFTLSDGSLVKFTVAKYYTANGTCLDGIGVTPDIPTEWTEEESTYRIVNGIEADKDFIAACEYLDSLGQ